MEFEVEVTGTPEQVWDAIATGPGISAWFMPAEVDETTIRFKHGADMSSEGTITDADKPHRFRFDEGEWGATEFLVEARAGYVECLQAKCPVFCSFLLKDGGPYLSSTGEVRN